MTDVAFPRDGDHVSLTNLGRRQVVGAGSVGILSMSLPRASAAASAGPVQTEGLAAPTDVTAVPIGYPSLTTTGAIRVSWSPVGGATGYEVGWTTASSGSGPSTFVPVGDSTEHDLTDLVGADEAHRIAVRAVDESTTSLSSIEVTSSPVIATGGTVSTFSGDGATDGTLTNTAGATYVVHTFTAGGAFSLNRTIDIDYLVVAGGGGGGSRHGGGGGAGGFRTGVLTDRAPGAHAVLVGAGGAGEPANTQGSGTVSEAGGDSAALDVTAAGGGRGGGSPDPSGGNGGSGGGSSVADEPNGSGEQDQGSDGGSGAGTGGASASGPYSGGGGGGAGAPGAAAVGTAAGSGGAGRASVIAGNVAVIRAGGGGGSTNEGGGSAGSGGTGGGGAGAFGSGAGADGSPGTGGGGGGAGFSGDQNRKGGDGGTGVVVLRYTLPG